jgi:hypothetical protein
MLYLKGEKVCICGLVEVDVPVRKKAWVCKTQSHKLQIRKSQKKIEYRYRYQIANLLSATFAEGPQKS